MQSQDEKSAEIKLPAKIVPIGPVEVKLSRQRIRHIGRNEHYFRVNQMLSHRSQPLLSRKERRKAARDANKRAWDARDKELIAKYREGFTNGEIPGQRD